MKIKSIIGIEKDGEIISEYNFDHNNILSTKKAIEEYFAKYGYSFVIPFNLEHNLIVVKDKNVEVSMLLGIYYQEYKVINYVTGEVADPKISPDRLDTTDSSSILPFAYRIQQKQNGYRLIKNDDDTVLVEADYISFISADKAVYNKYNIDYILDLRTLAVYPLIKRESIVYQGPKPEEFIDFRNGMYYQNQRCIFPVDVLKTNLDRLIEMFPFGMKGERVFFLLDKAIKYGIRVETEEISEVWYESKQERDKVYHNACSQVMAVINQEHEKQKVIKPDDNV